MNSKKKNECIEVLRIVLTMAVCLHHLRAVSPGMPYGGSVITPDGFYIITGLFFAYSVKNMIAENKLVPVYRFLVGRYMRVLPSFLTAYIVALIIRAIVLGQFLQGNIWGNIAELFVCEIYSNAVGDRIIPPGWYLGYLLIAQIVIYAVVYIAVKMIKPIGSRISVLGRMTLVLGGYAYLFVKYGHICIYPQEAGFISIDVLIRAICGIVSGTLIAKAAWSIQKRGIGNGCKRVIAGISIPLFAALIYCLVLGRGWSKFDYVELVILDLTIFVAYLLGQFVHPVTWLSKIIEWFGKICFTVYLNHYILIHIWEERGFAADWDWKIISVVLLGVILAFSICVFYLQRGVENVVSMCRRQNKEYNNKI